ncbi:hypothetical protein C7821_12317 [Streptomyces sp. VMFN-G11Ma]|nr:hypothetical protein C7821_12317 [Streptomyces sp. VMFN-G11Ma]
MVTGGSGRGGRGCAGVSGVAGVPMSGVFLKDYREAQW